MSYMEATARARPTGKGEGRTHRCNRPPRRKQDQSNNKETLVVETKASISSQPAKSGMSLGPSILILSKTMLSILSFTCSGRVVSRSFLRSSAQTKLEKLEIPTTTDITGCWDTLQKAATRSRISSGPWWMQRASNYALNKRQSQPTRPLSYNLDSPHRCL